MYPGWPITPVKKRSVATSFIFVVIQVERKIVITNTISPKFLVVRGRIWYKTINLKFWYDIDKYTSCCDLCINEILDSDPYTSTSWIGSLYIHCEPEVPMTIYNIASEVWMNLSHAYTFTMVINNNCWWLFLK